MLFTVAAYCPEGLIAIFCRYKIGTIKSYVLLMAYFDTESKCKIPQLYVPTAIDPLIGENCMPIAVEPTYFNYNSSKPF